MRILVAIGGSALSEPTLELGARVVRRSGASATVVTVVRSEAARSSAAEAAERARRALGPEARLVVRVGHPAVEVVREAEEGGYDLAMVGEKVRPGLVTRLLLGSTAARIVEHAPCPVIVAKGRPGPLARVLVCDSGATDPSPVARFVEQLGGITRPGDELTVLHVMSQIPVGRGIDTHPLEADAASMIAEGEPEGRMLDQDLAALAGLGLTARAKVRRGIVVEQILAEARDGDYGLVAIGAHRGTGWRRILLDDLAHEIIVSVDRPILVVR